MEPRACYLGPRHMLWHQQVTNQASVPVRI